MIKFLTVVTLFVYNDCRYQHLTFFLLSRCISLKFLTHCSNSSMSCCPKEMCTLPIFSVSVKKLMSTNKVLVRSVEGGQIATKKIAEEETDQISLKN